MKREIEFKDAEKNVVKVEVEMKDGNFSMHGDYGNGAGQIVDDIRPKNDAQEKLIELWNRWHLNDMKAGTPKQEEALKKWREERKIHGKYTGYDEECEYLKSIGLYEDNGYKYGTKWLKEELPEDIEQQVNDVFDNIEAIESEERGNMFVKGIIEDIENEKTDDNIRNEYIEMLEGYDNEEIALGIFLDLTVEELEEIQYLARNEYEYGGVNYFIGTYEEGEERAREYLEDDDYLWKEAVQSDRTTMGFDEWIDYVISMDGVGSILNSWDGSEEYITVNGTEYLICRM